jgi:hypothetical protein
VSWRHKHKWLAMAKTIASPISAEALLATFKDTSFDDGEVERLAQGSVTFVLACDCGELTEFTLVGRDAELNQGPVKP